MAGRGILPLWSLTDTEFRPRIKKKPKARKFTGYNINIPKTVNDSLYIGMVWIGTTNNVMPVSTEKCKATFIDQADSDDTLLNLSFEQCDVIIKITTDYEFLEGYQKIIFTFHILKYITAGIISSKAFALLFDEDEGKVFAKVYFAQLPLDRFSNKVGNTLKTLFAVVHDIQKVETNKGDK